ncbi:response regulator [Microbacterium sp. NPDC096154]|uniref:response regulator n=1 Tax=Microbacterium sp. NPDC096154 TaxID=3155549 RepID=UPI00332E752F
MALARLHGGPLDGQVLPLESPDLDQLILPFSDAQLVYDRAGEAANTGDADGPTEVPFRFAEEEQGYIPGDDHHPGA